MQVAKGRLHSTTSGVTVCVWCVLLGCTAAMRVDRQRQQQQPAVVHRCPHCNRTHKQHTPTPTRAHTTRSTGNTPNSDAHMPLPLPLPLPAAHHTTITTPPPHAHAPTLPLSTFTAGASLLVGASHCRWNHAHTHSATAPVRTLQSMGQGGWIAPERRLVNEGPKPTA